MKDIEAQCKIENCLLNYKERGVTLIDTIDITKETNLLPKQIEKIMRKLKKKGVKETKTNEKEIKCSFCERIILKGRHKTNHHIMPTSFKKRQVREIKVPTCKTCHADLHYLFSIQELAEMPFDKQKEKLLEAIGYEKEKRRLRHE
jgi:hypothetical protein